jgi:hypothetical protein
MTEADCVPMSIKFSVTLQFCFFRFEAAKSRGRIPPPETPEKTMSADFDKVLPVLVQGGIVKFRMRGPAHFDKA